MYRFGLKLWSTNANYIGEVTRLYEKEIYQYIELYAVPGSFDEYISIWKGLNIPFVIHAAHFRGGMNLAKREAEAKNLLLIRDAQQFADLLKSDKIIVHPGIAGEINETARQLKLVNDKRILVENKPYYALDDNLICNGTTPEEIKQVIDTAGVGFCLDIGHSICAANAAKEDKVEYIKRFLSLKPKMYHLTDGDFNGVYDKHTHFGLGNYDLEMIMSLLPSGGMITVETEKSDSNSLIDYEKDIEALLKWR